MSRVRLRHRRVRRAGLALLAGYALAALAIKAVSPRDGEVFPVFSWSLFSRVPALDEDWAVVVDGAPFVPADIAAFMTVQKLGDAFAAGDAAAAARHRRLLEEHHLRGRPLEYELVRRRFDTLERWRTGAFLEQRTAARFVVPP